MKTLIKHIAAPLIAVSLAFGIASCDADKKIVNPLVTYFCKNNSHPKKCEKLLLKSVEYNLCDDYVTLSDSSPSKENMVNCLYQSKKFKYLTFNGYSNWETKNIIKSPYYMSCKKNLNLDNIKKDKYNFFYQMNTCLKENYKPTLEEIQEEVINKLVREYL